MTTFQMSQCQDDDIDDDPFDDDQPELVPYHGADQGRLLRDHICNTFF